MLDYLRVIVSHAARCTAHPGGGSHYDLSLRPRSADPIALIGIRRSGAARPIWGTVTSANHHDRCV